MNRVELLGTVEKQPKIASTPQGKQVVSFTLTIRKKGFGKAKGQVFESNILCESWHDHAIHNVQVGYEVLVIGELKNSKYKDKNGNEAWITKVNCQYVAVKDNGAHRSTEPDFNADNMRFDDDGMPPF